MKLKAYPKINLCLKVYKGLSSGKHKIDSIVFLYKKIHDTIHIKKANKLSVIYKEGKKYIELSDCLITRSLQYLNAKYGININYKINVIKRVPFGAGLGGGSSDAAAVINWIMKDYPQHELDLKQIAVELGSDIPFFLTNYQTARVKNLGEYVAPIHDLRLKVRLVISQTFCSTNSIFRALESDKDYVSQVDVNHILRKYLYKQHLNVVYNDLTKYVIQNYSELKPIYEGIKGEKFFTGSGGTIVVIEGKNES
ncbi:MAG: hypothetical protein MJ223_00870 [Mycoplasmoidaceae bacterium]|nr:hypothetical protein [Mycoplasmoidaceae bacterium]